jgi:lipid II:glycine glycyltransferase (peptidoglycan interpeptide bridge formation enzyme)
MAWLLWQAMLFARDRGCGIFDFEGSMVPGVARFYRNFGARPVSYPGLIRYRWPRLFRLGRLLGV